MNRRGFFKSIGIVAAAVVAAPMALMGKRKTTSEELVDSYMKCHGANLDRQLALMEESCKQQAEPILFVGGPLHGQIKPTEKGRWIDGMMLMMAAGEHGTWYTRQGPYAIAEGTDSKHADDGPHGIYTDVAKGQAFSDCKYLCESDSVRENWYRYWEARWPTQRRVKR